MTAELPEAYQKHAPLYGMENFARWRHASQRRVSPSDIDAWQHARKGDRHLFLEFKTTNETVEKMGGQLEGLLSLSRKPGVQVVIVFDPYWNTTSTSMMDPDTPLTVKVLRGGVMLHPQQTTIGRFSEAIRGWQWNEGALAEPTVDYVARVEGMLHAGAGPAQIVAALGLPVPVG